MTVKDFDKLSKRDFENGAVINEIRESLKQLDNLNGRIERAKSWHEYMSRVFPKDDALKELKKILEVENE